MSQIVVSNKNNKRFCIKVASKGGKQRKYRFRLKIKSKKKEDDNCSVCYNEFTEKTCTLNCGHKFCTTCIFEWFKKNPNCPICRAEVNLLNRSDVEKEIPLMVIPPLSMVETACKMLDDRKSEYQEEFGKPMSEAFHVYGVIVTLSQVFENFTSQQCSRLRARDPSDL